MPISISNAYIETFENTVRHLAQQSDSRLRKFVTEKSNQSEKHNWDRLAASAAVQKTAARVATPAGGGGTGGAGSTDGLDWTRRVSLVQTWHAGEIVEMEDPVQMLIDPKSSVAMNLGMNMRRAVDDIIIAAATGAATIGDGSTVNFPAGQTVGTGAEVITLDTILEVGELFHANDVDPDEEKVFVVGPTQWRRLMQLLEITSADFQTSKALSTGVLPNVAGFTFVLSNRLNVPVGGQLDCLAFTKKALGLHVARDITAKVSERADLSYSWQFYCNMTMGAVRVEDEHIVRVHLKDALS